MGIATSTFEESTTSFHLSFETDCIATFDIKKMKVFPVVLVLTLVVATAMARPPKEDCLPECPRPNDVTVDYTMADPQDCTRYFSCTKSAGPGGMSVVTRTL